MRLMRSQECCRWSSDGVYRFASMSWSWKCEVTPMFNDTFLSMVYSDQNAWRLESARGKGSDRDVAFRCMPMVWHILNAIERYVQQRWMSNSSCALMIWLVRRISIYNGRLTPINNACTFSSVGSASICGLFRPAEKLLSQKDLLELRSYRARSGSPSWM